MKRIVYFIPVIIMFFTGCNKVSTAADGKIPALIPAPVSISMLSGDFVFSGKTKIIIPSMDTEMKLVSDFLAQLVNNPTGLVPRTVTGTKPKKGSVFMTLDTAVKNNEGYILTVTPKWITIHAKTAIGFFYAVQTIRQLLPVEVENQKVIDGMALSVPACIIKDEPRFVYRGMHLDVGRHLFPVATIKRYIDMLALHKMNTFHWHLTEDQGWRIEIKKYP